MNPKVTVIIPTYNRATLLRRAIQSVLTQTLTDFEVVVVDDASTDDTPQAVAEIGDSRARPIRHHTNKGVSAARNTGIANARGEYIPLLDDDDELAPNALDGLVSLLQHSPPEVGFAYGWVRCIDALGGSETLYAPTQSGNLYELAIARQTPVASTGTAYRISVVRELGGYDETMTLSEDIDLVTRLLAANHEARVLRRPVAKHYANYGGHQMTIANPAMADAERKVVELHVSRYSAELSERPEAHSNIYWRLALLASECGNKAVTRWALLKMVAARPTPAVLFRFTKAFLWRATPLSHVRDRARAFRDRLRGRK